MPAIPDESEVQVQVDALHLKVKDLEARLQAAGLPVPGIETQISSNVLEEKDQLAAHAEQLEKALNQSGQREQTERHPWRWGAVTAPRRPRRKTKV